MTIFEKLSKEKDDCIVALAQGELLSYFYGKRSFELIKNNERLTRKIKIRKQFIKNMAEDGISAEVDHSINNLKLIVTRDDLLALDYANTADKLIEINKNLKKNIQQLRVDLKKCIKNGMNNPKIIKKTKCFGVVVHGIDDLYKMIRNIVLN